MLTPTLRPLPALLSPKLRQTVEFELPLDSKGAMMRNGQVGSREIFLVDAAAAVWARFLPLRTIPPRPRQVLNV